MDWAWTFGRERTGQSSRSPSRSRYCPQDNPRIGGRASRHDYYPFCQERTRWTEGETHKFTGHERDGESGLDHMKARHFASSLGRFPQPDSFAFSDLGNPQSLNLYAYVLNNPLRYIDPTGHLSSCGGWTPCGMGGMGSGEDMLPGRGGYHSDIPGGVIIFGNIENRPGNGIYYYYSLIGPPPPSLLDFYLSYAAAQVAAARPPKKAKAETTLEVAVPPEVQARIDAGEPPDASSHPIFGISCPDCKYYPKEVVEAVYAHEGQHMKDIRTVSGFIKLFSEQGKAELEVRGSRAELTVSERNINALETKRSQGALSVSEQKTLRILMTMRDHAKAVIENPRVYVTTPH